VALANVYIAPWYTQAGLLYGMRFFPAPIWGEDMGPGEPNAWSQSYLPPWFRWRVDYPSPSMDEPLRSNEIRRTAAHEIGHTFELVCLALGIDLHRLYFEFRQFSGTWQEWLLEPWKQVREGFADCFGAALLGEWLIADGSSQADRYFNEGKTVTAVAARGFFMRLTGITLPAMPDCAFAEWIPSPNYTPGGNLAQYINDHWTVTATFDAALRKLTDDTTGPARVSAHYLIGPDGRIAQLVRERDQAWHNAMPGWNGRAIGIEHVHLAGQPWSDTPWPAVQLEASARLHRDIGARNGIPLTRTFDLGHRETGYATACPGDLPIDRLLEDYLNMEITETRLREIIREETTTPLEIKFDSFAGRTFNHKLRRTARAVVALLRQPPPATALPVRDPGGVGGTDTQGYGAEDDTPLG
jgi:hypothetical protein